MKYATYQEFLIFYQNSETSELMDIDGISDEHDTRIDLAISLAESEIDAILSAKFQLPLVGEFAFLKWATLVISRKNLSTYNQREKTRADYEDVIARLKDFVADGILTNDNGEAQPPKTDPDLLKKFYIGTSYVGERLANIPDF